MPAELKVGSGIGCICRIYDHVSVTLILRRWVTQMCFSGYSIGIRRPNEGLSALERNSGMYSGGDP